MTKMTNFFNQISLYTKLTEVQKLDQSKKIGIRTLGVKDEKLCKKLEVYKKVFEDLNLVDVVVVANIEDNDVSSTSTKEFCALDVCICKQHSNYLCFSNQMIY